MNEILILIAAFVSVLIVSAAVISMVLSKREVEERLFEQTDHSDAPELPADIRGISMTEAEMVRHYFSVIRSDKNPNSIANRLIRAGYFSPNAAGVFQIVRFAIAAFIAALFFVAISLFFPEFPRLSVFAITLFVAALVFYITNIALEWIGDKRESHYRKIFPDFMDTLVVCVDAGLSVEAAMDRVSKEFVKSSTKDFGLHLIIMMLEVRGGRRLRDALSNFAKRLRIEEAQSLSVLFRQSEELGASVTKTLRVFSHEMRDKRMIRAEEKANALPFKMLFPLAAFLFPISILIVAVPIIMKILQLFISLAR